MQTDHLADLLARHATTTPDTEAIVADGVRLTYHELARDVGALAASWHELGIREGDRIALDLPNGPEWVLALLAAAALRATVVPINPTLGYHELKYQLRHADVQVVVVPDHGGALDYLEFFEELISELPGLQYLVVTGQTDFWYDDRIFQFASLLEKGRRLRAPTVRADAHVPLALVYTSGTMGKPKGVLLSELNLLSAAYASCEILQLSSHDRVLAAVPFFAIFGIHVILTTLKAAATLVVQEHFDRRAVLDLIERERLTVVHGVPTMFELLMREPSFPERDMRHCRTGIVAGSPVSPDLVERIRRWCNVEIAYGLTETGPTISMTRPDDDRERRCRSVGVAVPGIEVRLAPADVDDEQLLPDGAGELVARGPNLMLGYYRMPGETATSMTDDGFFKTGDLAKIDADGYIQVVGRRKPMIIRGGHNIYPRELEDLLRTHPAVAQACIIGIPDDVLGERVCACIVTVEGAVATAADLTSYLTEQVAEYKVPDLVTFFDAFPTTQTGKVKQQELLERVTGAQQPIQGNT